MILQLKEDMKNTDVKEEQEAESEPKPTTVVDESLRDYDNDLQLVEIEHVFDTTENVTQENFGKIKKEKETILTDVSTGQHELEEQEISITKEADNAREGSEVRNLKDDILEDETDIETEHVNGYKKIVFKDTEEIIKKPKIVQNSTDRHANQYEPILYGMPKYVRLMRIGPATYPKGIMKKCV